MQLAYCRRMGLALIAVVTIAMTSCSSEPDTPTAAPMAQIASNSETAPAENGIDQLPPEEALGTVIANLDDAGTYRVSGTTSAGSTIDITFKTGEGSVGTVITDSEVELVAHDGVVYITSDAATIADIVGADVDDTIADKWLLISPESSSSFSIFAEGSDFAEAVLGSQVQGELTSVQEVNGVPAVGLMFAETGGTLWITATGEPLPLRFEEKGASGGSGILTFSDFGEDVDVEVPDEDDVVDPSTLPSEDDEDDDAEADESSED
ncbi:hypothetical protein [Phytoactinopolyspora mesophila]|uniref:LppX_LprAFG lipoprotein n=1 Tax=Phytoactinopolyspora mesophila TaxID=2650750 RepID=A0A7K3M2Z7_9ACTN|nr:hypothetical protein [Phytoactinopolyspora mesophila]NDL57397.1 hypothetical protein [Phytoactinopolyspora mesophila]